MKKNIARHGGNPNRIFVIGHSAGTYLAALFVSRSSLPGGARTAAARHSRRRSGQRLLLRRSPRRRSRSPKDTWGIDANVWKAASPGAYLTRNVPPMLLLYADGDDGWRRNQQGEFLTALRAAGGRDVETRSITGRTHNTVWSEMAKGDEDTSRAILQFVTRLAKPTSH